MPTNPTPNPIRLIEGAPLELGSTVLCHGDDGAMTAAGLALGVATSESFEGHRIAHGRAVLLSGRDSEDTMRRRLAALDPAGSVIAACADRLVIVPLAARPAGAPKLFALGTDGRMAPTAAAGELKQSLVSTPDVKLVVFDPLTAFLPMDWDLPDHGYHVAEWFGSLAADTGATVLAVLDGYEHKLLRHGEAAWVAKHPDISS